MKSLQRILALTIGSSFCAVAIGAFLAPLNLLSGGLGGIAIILNKFYGLNIGLLVFLMNIPLFLVAWKKLSREFVAYSLINMTIFSTLLGFAGYLAPYIKLEDTLLAAIIGGVLNGIGMGLTFRGRGSQGGLDIIAALIRKKWDIPLGNALMGANLVIVAVGGAVFGIQNAFYTLIAMYVGYQFLDKIQSIFETKKKVVIISEAAEDISQEIMNSIGRSVTFLQGQGAYSRNEQKVIYSIVSPRELSQLKQIIDKHDKKAFISIDEISEVRGHGFQERFI